MDRRVEKGERHVCDFRHPQETWRSPRRRRLLSRGLGRAKETEWRNSLAYITLALITALDAAGEISWEARVKGRPVAHAERPCTQVVQESERWHCRGRRVQNWNSSWNCCLMKPTLSFQFGIMMDKKHCSLTLWFPTLHFNPSSDVWIFSARCLSLQNHLHKGTQVGNGHWGNSSCGCRAT